jgi:uncharacterized protein YdaU (DUF1376 family)
MATKVDIWMPLYIADYLSATSRLTTEQHGAYLLLLMDYWKSGAPPDNDAVLAQITKLSPDAWANARTMLEPFFEIQDGAWFQSRVENEMVKANHNKKANKERGLKGAQARWGNKNAPSIVQAYSEQCLADSTSPSPSPTNVKTQKKEKPATSVACPDFVEQQVWNDWMTVRKGKGAKTLTETGWKKFINQAEKAGWPLEQAISHCCLKNWISFEADWVEKKQSPADKRQNHMAQLTRGMSTPKPQPFWSQPVTVLEEIPNVEPKRLL